MIVKQQPFCYVIKIVETITEKRSAFKRILSVKTEYGCIKYFPVFDYFNSCQITMPEIPVCMKNLQTMVNGTGKETYCFFRTSIHKQLTMVEHIYKKRSPI